MWVHLFSDGAVERATGKASAGGAIRDMEGNWIVGFNHFLGNCTPFEAELWGILNGILVMLKKGYKRATIQTDNLEVIKALIEKEMEDSGITILRRVQRTMCSE
ncbi:hypothetical protein Godav_025193, partial [Gossypium davidsonii]|nr:hypothetical protein [Gossypium davidsonii]